MKSLRQNDTGTGSHHVTSLMALHSCIDDDYSEREPLANRQAFTLLYPPCFLNSAAFISILLTGVVALDAGFLQEKPRLKSNLSRRTAGNARLQSALNLVSGKNLTNLLLIASYCLSLPVCMYWSPHTRAQTKPAYDQDGRPQIRFMVVPGILA
jgi:hypothetical protein